MYTHKHSHARASRRRCASTGREILPAPKSTTKIPTDLGRASATARARGGTSCKGWGTREHFVAAGLGDGSPSRASNAPKYGRGARARPRAVLSRLSASRRSRSSLASLQVVRAFPGRDLACLKRLAGVFGCLFGFGLGTFFFVCLLPCLFVF